jgi:hypothetical protein
MLDFGLGYFCQGVEGGVDGGVLICLSGVGRKRSPRRRKGLYRDRDGGCTESGGYRLLLSTESQRKCGLYEL